MDHIRRFVELGAGHGWGYYQCAAPAALLAAHYAILEDKIRALEAFFHKPATEAL